MFTHVTNKSFELDGHLFVQFICFFLRAFVFVFFFRSSAESFRLSSDGDKRMKMRIQNKFKLHLSNKFNWSNVLINSSSLNGLFLPNFVLFEMYTIENIMKKETRRKKNIVAPQNSLWCDRELQLLQFHELFVCHHLCVDS